MILPKLVTSGKWQHDWNYDLVLTAWFYVFVMSILVLSEMSKDHIAQNHSNWAYCYGRMAAITTDFP